jgi:hypothetical protein
MVTLILLLYLLGYGSLIACGKGSFVFCHTTSRECGQTLSPVTTGTDGRFKLTITSHVAVAHPSVKVFYQGNADLRPTLTMIVP